MLKPPQPKLGSIDGDTYCSLELYRVNFGDWMKELEFEIEAFTPTDIASIPWYLRWVYDRASLGLTGPFLHDYLTNNQGKYINSEGKEVRLSWFDVHLFFLVAMRLDGIPNRRAFLAFVIVLICNRPIWKI